MTVHPQITPHFPACILVDPLTLPNSTCITRLHLTSPHPILSPAGDETAADDLATAQESFAAAGGYDAEKRITNVLTGLGFRMDQFHRACTEFSGGWQMRIALARLLLGPAGQGAVDGTGGLLLLDEPTNHLDAAACKWLGQFLRSATGPQTSVVLVSHDEALIEDACNHIVEVRGKKLHHYVGGYKKFLELRALREAQARAGEAIPRSIP